MADKVDVTTEQRRSYERACRERAAHGLQPLHSSVEDFAESQNAARARLADAIKANRARANRAGAAT